MEKSSNKSSLRAQSIKLVATSARGIFTGSGIDVMFKIICIIIGIAALVFCVCYGAWHNAMFSVMAFGIYKAIRFEEDK